MSGVALAMCVYGGDVDGELCVRVVHCRRDLHVSSGGGQVHEAGHRLSTTATVRVTHECVASLATRGCARRLFCTIDFRVSTSLTFAARRARYFCLQ
jgi:hypothetical protein